jgi:tetratricopeptide (TPR) repeat protein
MQRFRTLLVVSLTLAAVTPLAGQTPTEELMRRVEAAENAVNVDVLLRGAAAARLLGDFGGAEAILERATTALGQVDNAWVTEMIFQALASGRGSNGMQRAFREARKRIRMSPQQIADVTNNFPSLLLGGEFDEMILSFSADHPDPDYRCPCLAEKAWVHRVAGRLHDSRILWGELVAAWDRNPLELPNPDAQANWQGQYARNLARAGRSADALAALEKAKSMPVSDDERPAVQRRWAQTHAELGDVESAVALLEPLIANSTLVTVNSLSTRYTWEPVRNTIEFQEMLARHR